MIHDRLINRYNFEVEWAGETHNGFTEITGLNMEIEAISMRNGNSREEIDIKIPGLLRYSEVSFKRAISKNNQDFFHWINGKTFGQLERRDIVIKLNNEKFEPIIVWRLKNCFPTKYIGPTLIGNDSNLAYETLVVVHEGMRVETL